MLQFIRDRAQGWIAWLIISLLIIPFALWGINSYFDGGGTANVATVNDTDISLRQYQQMYQQQKNRIRSMLGGKANAELVDSFVKPQDVIQGMIESELIFQKGLDGGYRVSDQQLAGQIQSIEAFQQDGNFSNAYYSQLLRNQGDTPASFESRMRRSLVIDQVRSGIVRTSYVTEYDIENYFKLDKQTRETSYVILEAKDYENEINVSDEEIKKYYNSNLDQFINPEKISVEYVELSVKSLEATIEPNEKNLQLLYEEEKSNFGVPEERRARHILFEIADQKDEKQLEEVRAKATKILQEIKQGGDFEALAKQHSNDPGSSAQGGDLGFFAKGLMDPAFEKSAFSLKVGEISDLVKSSFGFHIIKLDEIRPSSVKPLSEVHSELEKRYKQRKANELFDDLAETMTSLAFDQPESLDGLVEELSLEKKTSPKFSRAGGTGIFKNKKVIEAAFSRDVRKEKFNSEPIEVADGKLIVLRLKEYEAESQKDLLKVKEEIVKKIKHKKSVEKVAQIGKKFVAELKAGAAADDVIKEVKVKWSEPQSITRNDSKVNRGIAQQVFKMGKKVGDASLISGVEVNNGDFAIVRVLDVKYGNLAKITDEEKKSIRKKLEDMVSSNEFDSLVSSLKGDASIRIYEQDL